MGKTRPNDEFPMGRSLLNGCFNGKIRMFPCHVWLPERSRQYVCSPRLIFRLMSPRYHNRGVYIHTKPHECLACPVLKYDMLMKVHLPINTQFSISISQIWSLDNFLDFRLQGVSFFSDIDNVPLKPWNSHLWRCCLQPHV